MWASAPLRVKLDEKGIISVLAVTIKCAWWNRGPLDPNRSALPPVGVQPDPPSDKKPGDIFLNALVRSGNSRTSTSDANKFVTPRQHDIGTMFSLLLGFFALACLSMCAPPRCYLLFSATFRQLVIAETTRITLGARSVVELTDSSIDRQERAPMLDMN